MVQGLADRLGRAVDATGDEAMALKLRQAGLLAAGDTPAGLAEYRMRQLGNAVLVTAGTTMLGITLGLSPALVILLSGLGFVIGVTRWRSRIDRAIEERQSRMQIEIYTVNQLLAMQIRAGSGVLKATRRVVERGNGAVIDELGEAVRLQRSGMASADAFLRIAELTPERHCARTYSLLAAAEERGSDLAGALLALSEDVRESRRQALERRATRQRAAMLIPTIAVLAPIMLLFVAAPLPQIIFGIR
jgi:Flp pilus assembly protein TadB